MQELCQADLEEKENFCAHVVDLLAEKAAEAVVETSPAAPAEQRAVPSP